MKVQFWMIFGGPSATLAYLCVLVQHLEAFLMGLFHVALDIDDDNMKQFFKTGSWENHLCWQCGVSQILGTFKKWCYFFEEIDTCARFNITDVSIISDMNFLPRGELRTIVVTSEVQRLGPVSFKALIDTPLKVSIWRRVRVEKDCALQVLETFPWCFDF